MASDDRARAVGKVVSVQADRFIVELLSTTDNFTITGFDDVHYVARLGSFLMVPVQSDYVVVEIVGLREKEGFEKALSADRGGRSGSQKFLDVVPVGMLPQHAGGSFRFGVSTFPSLYADALYALDIELDRIFETFDATESVPPKADGTPHDPENASRYKAITIGTSAVFDGYDVKIKVDEFFGGHASVLGNTGSGKSCTVASILQSLFGKANEFSPRGATFIFFDVNGEYQKALNPLGTGGIGVENIVLDGSGIKSDFRLPHWYLNFSEWELLLQASEKTQAPVLRTALGLTGLVRAKGADAEKTRCHFIAKCILQIFSDGTSPLANMQRATSLLSRYGAKDLNLLTLKRHHANEKFGNFDPPGTLSAFLGEISTHVDDNIALPAYRNDPFSFSELEEAFDFAMLYEEAYGNRQIRDYCAQMITRYKSLRDNPEYNFLKVEIDEEVVISKKEEVNFLHKMFGLVTDKDGNLYKENQIIIFDMNSAEDETIQLVAAVLSRMTFKILRQADPRNRFPVHLVLEEAHRYIAEHPTRHAVDAGKIFERIAKEGRKYGLFLLVASQRPSELSKTVLSQCSNFIVHRIQNPDDLAHIRQMTPFISESVLRRLPSLPKQHALVFGSAVNLPTTLRVRDAKPTPESDDTRIRDLWFHAWDQPATIVL